MEDHVDSTSTGSAVGYPSHELKPSPVQLVRHFLEMIRFSHTLFALPFAVLACVFAVVVPNPIPLTGMALAVRLVGVLLCMVAARSAAMAFNRLVDARIDRANPRTANRHIPSGRLSVVQVWGFFLGMSLLFVAACTLFLPNWLPLLFSLPVLAWICGYSFAKRFTSAAHLWLGVALALSPICAWVAIRGETVLANPADLLPAISLALAIAFWVAGFDIIYACQDAEFDREQKLHSIPARFGVAGALRIAAGLHLAMLITLCLLPAFPVLRLGWIYWSTWLGVTIMVITQHSLVKPNDLTRVNVAFFHVNAILSFGFCLLAALDSLLG
jgi:4-hydroxybenzoate polyprenyltransferase